MAEGGLEEIARLNPDKICLCAINSRGKTLTGYYNCDQADKAAIAHNIYSDAIMDTLRENGFFPDEDGDEDNEEDQEGTE